MIERSMAQAILRDRERLGHLRTTFQAVLLSGAALIAAGSFAAPANAQVLLYENRLPDGYAYVRFVNTLPNSLTVKPEGFGDPVTLGVEDAGRVSSYYTVEKVADRSLSVDLSAGSTSGHASFDLKPGGFNTVLIGKDGTAAVAKVVTDQAEINQTRARLAFYNAVPECATAGLQLDPGGTSVFSGVTPGSMRGRSVNPAANAHVRAGCGATRTTPINLGQLSAGGQYSVWFMAPSGTPVAFMSENAIAPYLR